MYYYRNPTFLMSGLFQRGYYVLIFLICIGGCTRSRKPDLRVTNVFPPDSLIGLVVDNLSEKRIVMLGDGMHENGYYMRLVTGVLNRWVDELEVERKNQREEIKNKDIKWGNFHPGHSIPKKLILFVEQDSEGVAMMNRYFQTGDLSNWLMRHIQGSTFGGYSVDWVEYLSDLKQIKERVEKLNTQGSSHLCDFRVIGPEVLPQYVHDFKLTKDAALYQERVRQYRKARIEYNVRQRDELSSANIRDILNTNAEYKALIFYGSAHLRRGKSDIRDGLINYDVWVEENFRRGKQDIRALEDFPEGQKDVYGYYIAHYLDQYFSRDSVATFFTIKTRLSEEAKIVKYAEEPNSPDYNVTCKTESLFPFPLGIINCQAMLRPLFELRKKCSERRDEEEQIFYSIYTNRLYYNLKRSYLNSDLHIRPSLDSLLSHSRDSSDSGKKKFTELADRLITGFDAVRNIKSLDKWIAMPLKDSTAYLNRLNSVLGNLPSVVEEDEEQFQDISLDENTKTSIVRYKKDLTEYFLVELMWIGNTEEQNQARAELQRMTGLELKTAKEWSNWWRSKYRD